VTKYFTIKFYGNCPLFGGLAVQPNPH